MLVDAFRPLSQPTRRQFVCSGTLVIGLAACPGLSRGALGGKAPIWTVRKNGKSIYVLGESLPRPQDWHAPDVEELLFRCGHLWTETNQIYREPVGSLVKRYGMSGSATTLGLLSPVQKARLEQAAAAVNVSLDNLAGARPWLIGATLEDAGYQTTGLTGKSANTILSGQASKAGIPLSSEFAAKDDVFAWFGGMSPLEETQFLCYVVDGVLLGRPGSELISRGWLSGQVGPATKFVDHERRAYPELYAKLTVDRNRAWVARFETMLRVPKPTMVVVGLYHLVGAESLLVQMRRAGFEVHRGADGGVPAGR